MRLRLAGIVTAAVSALALAACGSSGLEVDGPTPGTPQITGPITVFAASSLKESFTIIGKKFEAAHPGVTVTFNFGASSTLATQITQKAPADVFASASHEDHGHRRAVGRRRAAHDVRRQHDGHRDPRRPHHARDLAGRSHAGPA